MTESLDFTSTLTYLESAKNDIVEQNKEVSTFSLCPPGKKSSLIIQLQILLKEQATARTSLVDSWSQRQASVCCSICCEWAHPSMNALLAENLSVFRAAMATYAQRIWETCLGCVQIKKFKDARVEIENRIKEVSDRLEAAESAEAHKCLSEELEVFCVLLCLA
jgi:hypothetical protein